MNIYNNKGMFLETIINNWCQEFNKGKTGYINKVPINYKLLSVKDDLLSGVISKNDNCDYIGIYKGDYIEFEAKETTKEFFPFNNIKTHQLEKMMLVRELGGIAFIVIYFHCYDRYFLLDIKEVVNVKNKKISIEFLTENGIEIYLNNLIIDLERHIDSLRIS